MSFASESESASREGPGERSRAAGALGRFRVLDLTTGATGYGGKLLADLGADVIKLEPPGGDPARRRMPRLPGGPETGGQARQREGEDGGQGWSALFAYVNAGKRSHVLDLERADDRDRLRRLVRSADVLLEDRPPGELAGLGLGYAELSRERPELVMTSITGFGQTGPMRGARSNDLVASALGGAMVAIGDPEDPPVRMAARQADVVTATVAAASSLTALYHRLRTGRGQHVDISSLEVMASVTHIAGVGKWLEDGVIPRRVGTGLVASVPSGAYRCRDGLVYLMVNRPAHWDALARWIHEVTGQEEVLQEIFRGPSSSRLPYREFLDLFISELTSRLTVSEAYHEGQRRRIAFTPVQTAARIAGDPHLAARNFFEQLDLGSSRWLPVPGAPYRPARTPWRLAGVPPRLDEHAAEIEASLAELRGPVSGSGPDPEPEPASDPASTRGALAGLRFVELGTGLAGPWIGRIMAWCGAEVIKVESHAHPDVPRLYVSPREPERGVQPECSPWFTDWNAGKRFVALDLTNEHGAELCRRLVAESDGVVANYGAGALDRLGLGYARLAERNPRLVMLCSNGYGETGPYARYVTWGPNIESLAGLSSFSGFPHRECTTTHFAYPDPLSALHGLVVLLAALLDRERTGVGQVIHLSQLETTLAAIGERFLEYFATGEEPAKLGNREPDRAPWGCFPCRGEDRWCVIAVEDDAEWSRLVDVLGRPAWAADPVLATTAGRLERVDELESRLAEWTAARDDYAVMEACQRAGVAAGVVQNTEDLYRRDPQLAARGFFETIPHRKRGEVVASGIPLGLTATPGRTTSSGACVGQDNDTVFRDLLGLSDPEYQDQIARGAIESPTQPSTKGES